MRIVRARQISQVYFLVLFLWLCIVATPGEDWWRLRGWPVNWFLQLDPLIAIGTVLTTRTLYAGLLWALVTIVLTLLLGRFFCSWVCPFGTLHHGVGYLGSRRRTTPERVAQNRYRKAQGIKYILLVFLLGAAAAEVMANPWGRGVDEPWPLWSIFVAGFLFVVFVAMQRKAGPKQRGVFQWVALWAGIWLFLAWFFSGQSVLEASLQTGLFDPIALVHRSVNLVVLPLLDASRRLAVTQKLTAGAWLIGALFLTTVLLNLKIPRFYCRFVCPLGALFGVLSRYALWRIGANEGTCRECDLCEQHCEGACEPAGKIRISECVLCMNCREGCRDDRIGYRTMPSERGETLSPDLSRRAFLVSLFSGVAAVPSVRLGGEVASNWPPGLIRPPGALTEKRFLHRCIKCGQCMRICPTNIIQPAVFEAGIEGFWSPVLNFRIGTSGCQYNCVACGQVCPTAAIRPVSMEEKQGRGAFVPAGPIRVGTAFVDRGRCLPWAMDRPCIVCEENCPVSPKAIFTREIYRTVRNGRLIIEAVEGVNVVVAPGGLKPDTAATGDYFLRVESNDHDIRAKIKGNTERALTVSAEEANRQHLKPGSRVEIQVLLKQPYVDLQHCTGCGICEHECPVHGKRAIRVTAENETRNKSHRLLLSSSSDPIARREGMFSYARAEKRRE